MSFYSINYYCASRIIILLMLRNWAPRHLDTRLHLLSPVLDSLMARIVPSGRLFLRDGSTARFATSTGCDRQCARLHEIASF
ncbi:MAG: hypothetical protein ACTSUE_25035 [Promethearchaeota archaeon]